MVSFLGVLLVPALDERTLFFILIGGCILAVLGQIWLILRAWGTTRGWGLAVLFLSPVAAPLYTITHGRRAAAPVLLLLVGLIVVGSPYALNRLFPPPAVAVREDKPDGPRDTLTGATETAVAAYLREHRDATVLQMANRPDVTDAILPLLRDMPHLRELDLNDTAITDTGLATLASLPNLESLRIARTRTTPEAVEQHILTLPKLKQIDVSGLKIPTKVLRAWKNAEPETRRYVN